MYPDRNSKDQYIPLAHSPDGEDYDDFEAGSLLKKSSSTSLHRSPYGNQPGTFTISQRMIVASLFLAFLSVLNIAILPITLKVYKDIPLSNAELAALPSPPKNMGLHQAEKVMPPPNMWNRSWPKNIARLSQKLKNAVYGDHAQVFISVEDSTLMRFPLPPSDSSSSRCAITWTPPPTQSARLKDLHIKGDVSEIELWLIISPNPRVTSSSSVNDINFDDLSWNTRPARGELLGVIDLSLSLEDLEKSMGGSGEGHGHHRKRDGGAHEGHGQGTMSSMNVFPSATTETFKCPEKGEELVVEFRCQRVACEVQYIQAHMTPKIGFEMVRMA